MTVEYLKLIKIDHENNIVQEEPLNSEGNVKDYVMDIVGQITDKSRAILHKLKDDFVNSYFTKFDRRIERETSTSFLHLV